MTAALGWLAGWAAPLFYTLLPMSLSAAAVGLVVLAVRRVFRRSLPPRWRYLLCCVVVVALVLPWRPSCPISLNRALPSSGMDVVQHTAPPAVPRPEAPADPAPAQPEVVVPERSPAAHHRMVREVLLPLLWLAGAAGMLGFLLIGRLRFALQIRRGGRPGRDFSALARQCRQELGVRRVIPVVVQDAVSSPALAGLLRPKILLPPCAEQMSPQTLRFVLLHELGHYRHGDLWVNELLLLVQCVHWFNPLVWVLFRQMRQDMELVNDSYLLKKLGQEQRRAYSQSLVEVLGLTHQVHLPMPAVCMTEGFGNTKRRIDMMKRQKFFSRHRMGIAVGCLLLIVALCVFFLTSSPKEQPAHSQSGAAAGSMAAGSDIGGETPSPSGEDPASSTVGTIPMPQVVYWRTEAAKENLEAVGLAAHIEVLENHRQWQPGCVVRASAAEGELLSPGQQVTLYVAGPQEYTGKPQDDEHAQPDFLTEEQLAVYRQAEEASQWLLADHYSIFYHRPGNSYGQDYVGEDNMPFTLVEGADSDYEAFCQEMLTIFTPECLEQIGFYTSFDNHNGQLAINGGGYGGNSYKAKQPDTWVPGTQTDTLVEFTLVGHYIDARPDEDDDAFLARRESLDFDWSESFPIRMVKTADGWRIAEFHDTSF